MNVFKAAYGFNGHPYPIGPARSISCNDILQLGKLTSWGDNCIRFVLRLRHDPDPDAIFFVKVAAQGKQEQKWLYSLGRSVDVKRLKGIDWSIAWSAELPLP